MSVRVFVGRSFADGWLIFAGVIGAIITLLLVLAARYGPPDPPFVVIAAVPVGVFVYRVVLVLLNRRWLTDTDTGFVYEDRRGTFEFTDEHVCDLGTWVNARHLNGHALGGAREVRMNLLVGASTHTLKFRYTFKDGRPDPLAGFFGRLLGKLAWAAETGKLVGDGWVLDGDELRVGRQAHPTAELAAVDVVDGHVCVWFRQDERPAVRIRAGSLNALVLAQVLGGRVAQRPRGDEDDAPGVGRVLFERDHSTSIVAVLFFMVMAPVLVLCVWSFVGTFQADPTTKGILYGVGGVVTIAVVIGIGLLLRFRPKKLMCHSRGVYQRWGPHTTTLRYEEVGSFTFSGTRNYVNAVYTGTQLELTFRPRNGGRPIHYAASVENGDAELDRLREHISRVIVQGMLRRLRGGRSVAWTDTMLLRPEGIEYTQAGWIKSKTLLIPFDDIADVRIDNGHFCLAVYGRKGWLITEPVSQPNFFPGYVLLTLLLSGDVGADTQPQIAHRS